MKYSISLLAVLALILCAAAAFATEIPSPPPGVVKWLPASDEVPGWAIQSGTLVYAVGKDLTEIYDGDYETYTKAGVLEAAQQSYKHNGQIVTVTINQLDSFVHARNIYKKFEAEDKKLPTYKKLTLLSETYVYSTDDAANGYLFRGKYFATVTVNVGGQPGRAIVFDFLKNVSKGYWKLAGK